MQGLDARDLGFEIVDQRLELAELVETLKAEIARVEAARAAKQVSLSAADAAFKR